MTTFTPTGIAQLANALPELRGAELSLRAKAAAAGIEYGLPDYAGLRTPIDTTQLIRWRDEAVAKARRVAEAKRRAQGGTAVQIKDAGDVAARAARYPVSSFATGFHGIGGAFDIKILTVPKGMPIAQAYAYLGSQAASCGLTWGGTFSEKDPFHFQLAQSRAVVEAKWKTYAAANQITKATGGPGGVAPLVIIGLLLIGGLILAATSRPEV